MTRLAAIVTNGSESLDLRREAREKTRALLREMADTGDSQALNSLAWELATAADPAARDGSNAVVCAEKAVALTSRTNASYLDTLAAAYAEFGQFDKAIATEKKAIQLLPTGNDNQYYVQCVSLYEASMPYRDHGALADYVRMLLLADKFAEAEPLARECLRLREKLIPDKWSRFNAQSMLGGSLLGQKKYAEAEPLLLAGYEGMKQRERSIPAASQVRVKETLERLVELYEATNRPEKAAEWKQEIGGVQSN
jgi:tetratricopeptide (TPR) repeat protein